MVYQFIFAQNKIRLEKMMFESIMLFIATSGVFSGVKLIFFAFSSGLQPLLKDEGIDTSNIVLGGLALVLASGFTIVYIFVNAYSKIPIEPIERHPTHMSQLKNKEPVQE